MLRWRVFQYLQRRVCGAPHLSHSARGAFGQFRVHRMFLQPSSQAFHAQLSESGRLRATDEMISNFVLSGKARQAQIKRNPFFKYTRAFTENAGEPNLVGKNVGTPRRNYFHGDRCLLVRSTLRPCNLERCTKGLIYGKLAA